MKPNRYEAIKRRHARVRRRIQGTTERPRLVIKRSLKNLYAQVFDDEQGRSIVQLSTTRKEFPLNVKKDRSSRESAKALGQEIAKAAQEKGVSKVVFDRGGSRYHGVIKEFADAARGGGLEF